MGYPSYDGQGLPTRNSPLAERERIDRVIATGRVLQEVWAERDAQDEKWGQQNWPPGNEATDGRKLIESMAKASVDGKLKDGTATWVDILNEEFEEFVASPDLATARRELVQVAAVAVAAVERIDRMLKEQRRDELIGNAARTMSRLESETMTAAAAGLMAPHPAHDMSRDTLGGCTPTSPCPACQTRLAAKKEY